MYKKVILHVYKLSHKREWNTEKYSASASHIQGGPRPSWIWEVDARYFAYFHERACDNVFIFKQTMQYTHRFLFSGNSILRT